MHCRREHRVCSLTCCLSFFFFSSRRRHTRFKCDWSSDVCSSDLSSVTEDCLTTDCHPRGPRKEHSSMRFLTPFLAAAALAPAFVPPLAQADTIKVGIANERGHKGRGQGRCGQEGGEIGRAHVCTPVTLESRMPA